MKLIKGFVLTLAGLFVMILMVSLLMPSTVTVVKTVVISADKKDVFKEIEDLKSWRHWHPVFMNERTGIVLSSPSRGVNAFATWSSNAKKNKLLITQVLANHVRVSMVREGENEVTNIISITPLNDSSGIQAEWRIITKLKWFPWEKFSGIFVDKITGPGYQAALNNLKGFIENKK